MSDEVRTRIDEDPGPEDSRRTILGKIGLELGFDQAELTRRIETLERRARGDALYETIQAWVVRGGSIAFSIVIIIKMIIWLWRWSF